MNSSRIILLSIFFVTVIPTTYIYFEHGLHEYKAFLKNDNIYDKIKTLGESVLFLSIGIGYVILSILLITHPKKKIPYLVILIGTAAVVILYYCRIFGIPVPFTDVIITDSSTGWRDVVTKICQQILVIPIAMLYREMFPKKTKVN